MKTKGLIQLICLASLVCLCVPVYALNEVAQKLNWVSEEGVGLCGGYFIDPDIQLEPKLLLGSELALSADKSVLTQSGLSTLSGNVRLVAPYREASADMAEIYRDDELGEISAIELSGNIELREQGRLVRAKELRIDNMKDEISLSDALYRIDLNHKSIPFHLGNVNAWGTASHALARKGSIDLSNASYTTCAPTVNTWSLHAREIYLDEESGRGRAKHVIFNVHNVPILYSPYLSFPIDPRRKSGFLFPSFGRSSDSGYNFSIPFYWNIAPNYDLTLTPGYMSKRGAEAGVLFRYLTSHHSGSISGTFLPKDSEFRKFRDESLINFAGNPNLSRLEGEGSDRSLFSFMNQSKFNEHVSSNINFNYVSDDYYFQDFSGSLFRANENQLPRDATINYESDYWTVFGRIENYQTLHPVNQKRVENQYSRLPQLYAHMLYPEIFAFTFEMESEFVFFDKMKNPEDDIDPVTGLRFNFQPTLSYPYEWSHGFFNPSLELQATFYSLNHQTQSDPEHITRFLPILSVDNGLELEHEIKLFNKSYVQTIEPRLYYLLVPYEYQQNIPLFDTALSPFDYEQLFRKNRFNGVDRTNDANQLSLGLSSKVIDEPTGRELWRFGIGQTYYFQGRKVVLCDTISCASDRTTLNSVSNDNHLSPLVGQIDYYLSDNLYLESGLAWDFGFGEVSNAYFRGYFQGGGHKIVNLGYTFVRSGDAIKLNSTTSLPTDDNVNNLSHADAAIAWPLSQHWHFFGRMNYNVSHHHTQTTFVGAQYDSCCWALRVAAGRKFKSFSEHDNPTFENDVYIQLQFKGLGSVRSGDAGSMIKSGLPHYEDTFEQGLF